MPMAEGLSSVQPFTERLYTFWSNEFDQCAVFKFTLGVSDHGQGLQCSSVQWFFVHLLHDGVLQCTVPVHSSC